MTVCQYVGHMWSIQDEYSWTSVSQWCALSKKVWRPLLMICHAAALLAANTELVQTCILIKITWNCGKHCRGKQSFMNILNSDRWVSKQMKLRFVKHLRIQMRLTTMEAHCFVCTKEIQTIFWKQFWDNTNWFSVTGTKMMARELLL